MASESSRVLAVTLTALVLGAGSDPVGADEYEWKAGVASAVITPEEPVWLCGYDSRIRPAEGKVHDLYAKALAFQSKREARLVVITLDLGSVSERITEGVATRVADKYGLPRGSLVLNCSHTHCAPEVAAERRIFHAMIEAEEAKLVRYIAKLEDKLVELVGAALADLAPARLSIGASSARFASNRRFPTEQGFRNRENRAGVADQSVPTLTVSDPNGKLRAVLFGYACHNTTLAFYRYCGDYAGFAQEYIEAAHPGVTALFLMGCGGDQNPYPRHGPKGLEYCRSHGRALADAVDEALAGKRTEVHGPLRVAYEVVTLDLEPLPPLEKLAADAKGPAGSARRKGKHLLERLETDGNIDLTQTCPLHAARFGEELLLIAISGETVVDYSLTCKREFAGPYVWVAGYNDDVFAYLPSLRVLREGGYEGRTGIIHQLTPTPFDQTVEERVMGGIRRLVREVTP